MNRQLSKLLGVLLVLVLVLVGCSNGSSSETDSSDGEGNGKLAYEAWKEKDPTDIEGNLTVITQRTDIVDTVFQEYKDQFNEKYPNVNVSFEALTDYGGEIMPRMQTEDYGDVQFLPVELPIADIPNFFEPLGELAEMEESYYGVEERAVDGTVYGIPIAMTYTGIIYNTAVFEEAGVTELPKTQEDYIAGMKKVKENTDATPLYTNYAAGWPLTQWEGAVTTTAGDVDYYNVDMLDDETPFDPGDPHYDHYKLMYDLAEQGLIEEDPLTTDWEASKVRMNNGEIATMVLGSWALQQIQDAGENGENIAIMPYPTNADETIFSLGADLNISINKHSKNKEAAFAWVDWFIHESGYAEVEGGGISAYKEVELPAELQEAQESGATFSTLTPSPDEKQGLLDEIDKESEVGLWLEPEKQKLIEAAIGNRDLSYDDIMNDWNERWKNAYEKETSE
ncbi:ABC-type glycerol-3-phosphate transport system substrate-binding protein [Gracilibacillus halotolerans]|uniref:ABC-type glycerol-3-phosphate transport system substrate-binding protein n=1 Tax=Gracilibacillus halotolerans TaxID=74386 RepID=A0A841RRH9_9BACI|nr:ABC transporter substrate-binding protein [Gracilibacillus halotolerans]MBB6514223.1 ABC-type glycerol-3-phosphate transport system substrate-binding protein [Gracilibacillus halotolerans]